jgi:hypothetical protein
MLLPWQGGINAGDSNLLLQQTDTTNLQNLNGVTLPQ